MRFTLLVLLMLLPMVAVASTSLMTMSTCELHDMCVDVFVETFDLDPGEHPASTVFSLVYDGSLLRFASHERGEITDYPGVRYIVNVWEAPVNPLRWRFVTPPWGDDTSEIRTLITPPFQVPIVPFDEDNGHISTFCFEQVGPPITWCEPILFKQEIGGQVGVADVGNNFAFNIPWVEHPSDGPGGAAHLMTGAEANHLYCGLVGLELLLVPLAVFVRRRHA